MEKQFKRSTLLSILDDAFVLERFWHDRDSASAQRQVGEAYQLLKSGCKYEVLYEKSNSGVCTDAKTIWLKITFKGFNDFEYGSDASKSEIFYMPTRKRLQLAAGKDWY